MRDYLLFKPYEGRTKVAIIREADRLSEESGGALLKTLEEPTANTLIVLTAISASRVMETLVSRCLNIMLPPLTRPVVLKALKEKRGLTGPKAELIGGLSCGALGMALELDPELAWSLWEQVGSLFALPIGTQKTQKALEIAASFDAEYKALKAKDDATSGYAEDYLNLLSLTMRLWFRDAAVLASTGNESFLEGPLPSKAQKKFAASLSIDELNRYERSIWKFSDSIGRFIRSDLVFENFLLEVLK
jgi:DNA polymerase III gamma/tau subunit